MAIELANTGSAEKRPPRDRTARSRPTASRFGHARVSTRDRMFFTERLALLLETGNPLHRSLEILSRQAGTPALSALTIAIREDMTGGVPFSEALAGHPEAFPTTYVNLIAASEQGGFMAEVLDQLMKMEEKQAELRSTLVGAFSYPGFLIVFSLAVIVFVLTFVFPKFAVMFHAIRDQLPLSTVVLMAASDILRLHWPYVLAGLGGAIVGTRQWLVSERGGAFIDALKLRVPVIRDVFVQLYLAQSMRVMGLSLGHGVSVPDALRACRDVVRNREFRALMAAVEHDVQEGRGVTPAFERARFIPSLAKQMIATGEETGNLHLVMTRIAQFYERELTRKLQALAKLVEPLMLLVMGAVVGVIVASLILPIFKLSRAAG